MSDYPPAFCYIMIDDFNVPDDRRLYLARHPDEYGSPDRYRWSRDYTFRTLFETPEAAVPILAQMQLLTPGIARHARIQTSCDDQSGH